MVSRQIFDVGIAEAHAVTFAAGLAAGGLKPVFAVYSSFLQRAYDQILHDVCIQQLHVVFAIDRAGLVGSDGETHQGIFDISFLSSIPNMTICAPKNDTELKEMIRFAVEDFNGPIAIRYQEEVPAFPSMSLMRLWNMESQRLCILVIMLLRFWHLEAWWQQQTM